MSSTLLYLLVCSCVGMFCVFHPLLVRLRNTRHVFVLIVGITRHCVSMR